MFISDFNAHLKSMTLETLTAVSIILFNSASKIILYDIKKLLSFS